jgi:surface carbohydrate biosynthesis protein (TIGR04326 family)
MRTVVDFSPMVAFQSIRKSKLFRQLFLYQNLDLYPLFSDQLLCGFLNPSIPHHQLVAMATEKACRLHPPKITVSFLEHHPYSRAHYEGVSRGAPGAVTFAVQHASYSHEKTFVFLHPRIEFLGEPDGCSVPHPDYVCSMGFLGQRIFAECGYPSDRILVTGSPRYDHVRIRLSENPRPSAHENGGQNTRLLLVTSLAEKPELEMIEAVHSAVIGNQAIELRLRSHPFNPIERSPAFYQYRSVIQETKGALKDDLAAADLILFTYSTVAEEAILQGKTVWQWLSLAFNGSALAEVAPIPRFCTVQGLRKALETPHDPSDPRSHALDVEEITAQLFYKADGNAATRISAAILSLLGRS